MSNQPTGPKNGKGAVSSPPPMEFTLEASPQVPIRSAKLGISTTTSDASSSTLDSKQKLTSVKKDTLIGQPLIFTIINENPDYRHVSLEEDLLTGKAVIGRPLDVTTIINESTGYERPSVIVLSSTGKPVIGNSLDVTTIINESTGYERPSVEEDLLTGKAVIGHPLEIISIIEEYDQLLTATEEDLSADQPLEVISITADTDQLLIEEVNPQTPVVTPGEVLLSTILARTAELLTTLSDEGQPSHTGDMEENTITSPPYMPSVPPPHSPPAISV